MKQDSLPYSSRNNNSVGKHHGIGIPTQYGAKKGGYTDSPKQKKLPIGHPPRNF
jgi:hypothetical protein